MNLKKMFKELEGQEVWTDAFGERKCIGVKNGKVVHGGKVLPATREQKEQLVNEYIRQESGAWLGAIGEALSDLNL